MDPEGKIALVTGGACGIGLATVRELLTNGAKVVICDKNVEAGKAVLDDIVKQYGENKAIFIEMDVTNQTSFEDAIKKTIATFKGFDILINNAGILKFSSWELEIAINLGGVVRGTLLALDYMGKDKGGKGGVVVNMSSIAGVTVTVGAPVYAATKHGVLGLTRSLGMPFHFKRTGVRIMAMCPGMTDTPLVDRARIITAATDVFSSKLATLLKGYSAQRPGVVSEAVLHTIRHGSSGSIWISEGGTPAYEIRIPDKESMKIS